MSGPGSTARLSSASSASRRRSNCWRSPISASIATKVQKSPTRVRSNGVALNQAVDRLAAAVEREARLPAGRRPGQPAHVLVNKSGAARPNLDQQPHDRVAMNAGQALSRAGYPNRAAENEPETLTLEHILPKNPGQEWAAVLKDDPIFREDCTYRINNLCLLTKGDNKDLGPRGV
jgi:hypothetical protein